MAAPVDLGLPRVTSAFGMEEWVRVSKPGDRCIYHHGHLAADRQGRTLQARQLDRLASFAHSLGEIDEIVLRPCGHIKAIKPGAKKLRLLQMKDQSPEAAEGARAYIAELKPDWR